MKPKILDELLASEKEISYEECQKIWEDSNTLVHKDTSDRLVNEVTSHIINRCELKDSDNLLNIGCGDGLFDAKIVELVNSYYGLDFSAQKLEIAKQRLQKANYYQHNFLNPYSQEIINADITKIYSYSVVQYCKPDDLDRFIYNQLMLCDKDREYLIAHLDVPDRSKAFHYYKSRIDGIQPEDVSDVKTLFGDGSYWHDMEEFMRIAKKYGIDCQIKDAHYWDYRSDIIIRFNGKGRNL